MINDIPMNIFTYIVYVYIYVYVDWQRLAKNSFVILHNGSTQFLHLNIIGMYTFCHNIDNIDN